METTEQAVDSHLFVDRRAGGGTGVMSLGGGQHTGFTSAVMVLTSTALNCYVQVIGEVVQKCHLSQHGGICL